MSIELGDLHKAFGDVRAVDGLSLAVAPGEIVGLLGANGAGKTTALRVLVGLLIPDSGTVKVDGVDVVRAPDQAKSRLGFATASTGLYPRLTARELLQHVARLYGLPEDRVAARLDAVTDALDLAALLDRRCESLSTGQRQRVSLARAVVHDPGVLVLDEPTAGLDILASRFLRDFLQIERARGKTILLSTHYLTEAELLCDRVALVHRGRLLAEGTSSSLKARCAVDNLEEALISLVAQSTPAEAAV